MKRVGAKGEGKFEPMTWDAAVKEIAGQVEPYSGRRRGRCYPAHVLLRVMSVLQRKCGMPFSTGWVLVTWSEHCVLPQREQAMRRSWGRQAVWIQGSLDSSFYLVGKQYEGHQASVHAGTDQARSQGKRVVLIESCAADMDVYHDQTILIRPGTDGALALAMMHVMEEENLADRDFLAHQTEWDMRRSENLCPIYPLPGQKGDRHPRRGDCWTWQGNTPQLRLRPSFWEAVPPAMATGE